MASDLEHVDGPDTEPVSLAEAKAYCRIYADDGEDDAYVSDLIATARDFIERRNGRSLGVQTWRERRTVPADGVVRLFKAPIVSVESVTIGEDAPTHLVRPGNRLDLGREWAGREATITYKAGWSTIPPGAKLAMLALVVHWYELKTPVITGTIVASTPLHFEALEAALSWGSEIPRR